MIVVFLVFLQDGQIWRVKTIEMEFGVPDEWLVVEEVLVSHLLIERLRESGSLRKFLTGSVGLGWVSIRCIEM